MDINSIRTDAEIVEFVKKTMKVKGLNNKMLAQLCNCSEATISKKLNNNSALTDVDKKMFVRALGINPIELELCHSFTDKEIARIVKFFNEELKEEIPFYGDKMFVSYVNKIPSYNATCKARSIKIEGVGVFYREDLISLFARIKEVY